MPAMTSPFDPQGAFDPQGVGTWDESVPRVRSQQARPEDQQWWARRVTQAQAQQEAAPIDPWPGEAWPGEAWPGEAWPGEAGTDEQAPDWSGESRPDPWARPSPTPSGESRPDPWARPSPTPSGESRPDPWARPQPTWSPPIYSGGTYTPSSSSLIPPWLVDKGFINLPRPLTSPDTGRSAGFLLALSVATGIALALTLVIGMLIVSSALLHGVGGG